MCAVSAVKLVMTMVARNEDDVLDAHLRYHFARGVDFVIATDNGSSDRTSEVFESYARRGLLHLIHDPVEVHSQAERVTGMARLAATQFDADWVINSDADEFHWPVAGSLKDIFAAIPPEFGALDLPAVHFLPTRSDSGPFYERMVVREVRSEKRRDTRPVLLTKRAHRARPDIVVSMGNHRVNAEGRQPDPDVEPAPSVRVVPGWRPIEILHFPARSYKQVEKKVALAGKGYPTGRGGALFALPGGGPIDEDVRARDLKAGASALHREGQLEDWYREKILDDEAIAEGIRQGRLMFDERMRQFLTTGMSDTAQAHNSSEVPATGGAMAWPTEPPVVAELRADMMRAIREYESEQAGIASFRRELDQVEHSRWWRLGRLLYRVVRPLDFRKR